MKAGALQCALAGAPERTERTALPVMIVAAAAVIVSSLAGIAAITGQLHAADASRERERSGRPGEPASSNGAPVCENCGVVVSVRAVEASGRSTGLGRFGPIAGAVPGGLPAGSTFSHGTGTGITAPAVPGAVGGGAVAGIESDGGPNRSLRWHVRVQMDDGSYRTLVEAMPPSVSAGQKVTVENGTAVARG